MENARDLYEKHVKSLSPVERLRLARLIMDDLADSATGWATNSRDWWSEEDMSDLAAASLTYTRSGAAQDEDDETW